MADAVARQRYAGGYRLVELKQGIQEAQWLTPNTLKQGARSEKQRRGVTTISVITAEQHVVGDGVPATVVIKMSNQL